jgi:tripartite-type tricarboxylate transporter receptor subunit TctC
VNPQKALDPVALLGDVPNILVVPATSGIKTWKEFQAYAKSNSGNLNYGSTGIGTTAHLISFLFCQKTGIEATHIPYKGAEATRDLIAGRLQFMFATAPSVIPLIKAGQLNAIAVSSKKRITAMPDLATLNELGVDIATGAWFGLFAPAGTNPAIVKKLNETVVSILEEPAIRAKLLSLGADPVLKNVQEITNFVRGDFVLSKATLMQMLSTSLLTMLFSPFIFWLLFRIAKLCQHSINPDAGRRRQHAHRNQ